MALYAAGFFLSSVVAKRAKSSGIAPEGAKPAEMPAFIKPQLATLKSKAPKGVQWLHEIKYDGYRVQLHTSRGRKKVFTRNGYGEVVVLKDGRTNYSELQAELVGGRQSRLEYYACCISTAMTSAPSPR